MTRGKISEEEGGGIANVTGDSPTMAMPPTAVPRKPLRRYKTFNVMPETFRRFQNGKVKFERWVRYLNLQDQKEKEIYDYAVKNRRDVVVLRDSSTGALRAIRRSFDV
jgi:hypothetical protein